MENKIAIAEMKVRQDSRYFLGVGNLAIQLLSLMEDEALEVLSHKRTTFPQVIPG